MLNSKFILLLSFLLINTMVFTSGQDVVYTRSIGNHGEAKLMDMVKTSKNELVLAVDFPSSRHFQIGPYPYRGLYKFHNTGELQWSFEGLSSDKVEFGISIDYLFLNLTLDSDDNVYALLYADLYKELKVGDKLITPGLNLIKIDPQGYIVWNKTIGKNVNPDNACIKFVNEKLVVLGTYQDSLILDNNFKFKSQKFYQCYTWMYQSGTDYFVAKYDIDGNLQNAISFGEDFPDEVISLAVDENENIYFTGYSDVFAGCTVPYTHVTKLDKDLTIQWVDTLSYDNESPRIVPMDIHSSQNGKLYVWNNSIDNISNGVWTTDNKNPYLIELDSDNGQILRSLNINSRSISHSYYPTIRRFVNGFIDDFNNDLIVHTAFSDSLIINKDTVFSFPDQEFKYQSFVLLKIDLNDFSAHLIKKIDGKIRDNNISNRFYFNMPGRIITEIPYIYFAGNFGDDPLYIYDIPISNKSGNDGDTDVFLAKINMSTYLNASKHDNVKVSNYLDIFPNPASETVQITTDSKVKTVTIYSTNGHKLLTFNSVSLINISSLTNGIYLLEVKTTKGISLSKLIVRH